MIFVVLSRNGLDFLYITRYSFLTSYHKVNDLTEYLMVFKRKIKTTISCRKIIILYCKDIHMYIRLDPKQLSVGQTKNQTSESRPQQLRQPSC